MASNPAFGKLSPRFAGTLRVDSQNIEDVNKRRRRNEFTMPYTLYTAFKFGDVVPISSERAIDRDTATFSNFIELWSDVMKSPLMSNLRMYKDSFYVPYSCLLPNTWSVFKNTPVQGDDVPEDVYLNFPVEILAYPIRILQFSISASLTSAQGLSAFRFGLRSLAFFWYIFSQSSILKRFKIDVSDLFFQDYFISTPADSVDTLMEGFLGNFVSDIYSGPTSLNVYLSPESTTPIRTLQASSAADFAVIFDYILNGYDVRPVSIVGGSDYDYLYGFNLSSLSLGMFSDGLSFGSVPTVDSFHLLDFSEIYAYQMIGSQFYVNDNVDTVFTSKDWLLNLGYLMSRDPVTGDPSDVTFNSFSYNGGRYFYDILSLRNIIDFVSPFLSQTPTSTNLFTTYDPTPVLDFLYTVFVPFQSLRYGDYFVGSRISPLAVGADTYAVAPVVGNEVSAIDITKSIAWQSFLNDVMKLGPVNWIQQNGIYGDVPSSLEPMPRFISREQCNIGTMDIEDNSTEGLGNIVSRFRSSGQNFAYNCDITEDCILMTLVSFDIPRVYSGTTSRFAFTYDRYDFFNPYFQNIGDQEIYRAELSLYGTNFDKGIPSEFDAFAYTIRDTQYKQRYDIADGPFVGDMYLPSWAFITSLQNQPNLDSLFVRNHNFEFDRFFASFAGNSYAGRFHFYAKVRNDIQFVRAMQYRPDIQLPLIHQ